MLVGTYLMLRLNPLHAQAAAGLSLNAREICERHPVRRGLEPNT